MKELKVGKIVENTAGRDKGRLYLLIDLDDKYAYLADGDKKKIDNPKRKNPKHLKATSQQMQEIINLESKDIPNENAKIRKELRRIGKEEGEYV